MKEAGEGGGEGEKKIVDVFVHDMPDIATFTESAEMSEKRHKFV
jgi:hypothetical protein